MDRLFEDLTQHIIPQVPKSYKETEVRESMVIRSQGFYISHLQRLLALVPCLGLDRALSEIRSSLLPSWGVSISKVEPPVLWKDIGGLRYENGLCVCIYLLFIHACMYVRRNGCI